MFFTAARQLTSRTKKTMDTASATFAVMVRPNQMMNNGGKGDTRDAVERGAIRMPKTLSRNGDRPSR